MNCSERVSQIVTELERQRVNQERVAQRFHEVCHGGDGSNVCGLCLVASEIALDVLEGRADQPEERVKYVEGYQC